MMTRVEHLLAIAAEECAEVAHRCSKALRFGLSEVQPGQPLTNAERISREYGDLVSVLLMLNRECGGSLEITTSALEEKRLKVEKYLAYSAQIGTLTV